MPLTPLHLALGRDAGPITYDLFIDAVTERVREADALDWKQELPAKGDREFAKDVAAMANSGGGMLVYGLREDRTTSAAEEVLGVSGWADADERRLRQIAYSAIRPPVHGLVFQPVTGDGDAGRTVLALSVPSSVDAPHLVWVEHSFVAPIRYGAQTQYMGERDLEAAYRLRFATRDHFAAQLADRIEEVWQRVRVEGGIWLIANAVPLRPRPPHLGKLSRTEVQQQVLLQTRDWNPFTLEQGLRTMPDINPRAGLRRWRAYAINHRDQTLQGLLDLHDDGGLSYAVRLWTWGRDLNPDDVHLMIPQLFAADFLWVLRHAARAASVDSTYAIRATIRTTTSDPLIFRDVDEMGHPRDPNHSNRVEDFLPIDDMVEPLESLPTLLDSVRRLATDFVNQGGIEEIHGRYLHTDLP